MAARDDILKSIRGNLPPIADLPELEDEWITYDDPLEQFATVLEAVGGKAVRVSSADRLQAAIDQIPEWATATKRCSLVPSIDGGNVVLDSIEDPHELADVDFAVLLGKFAVAENAAVWLTDDGLKHRSIFVIAEHLALVVPADQIVHNMHQAYERLSHGWERFGVFISGPSKTADIEQSLVIGAHGARSLTVFLLG